jgi:hypothetical protein
LHQYSLKQELKAKLVLLNSKQQQFKEEMAWLWFVNFDNFVNEMDALQEINDEIRV